MGVFIRISGLIPLGRLQFNLIDYLLFCIHFNLSLRRYVLVLCSKSSCSVTVSHVTSMIGDDRSRDNGEFNVKTFIVLTLNKPPWPQAPLPRVLFYVITTLEYLRVRIHFLHGKHLTRRKYIIRYLFIQFKSLKRVLQSMYLDINYKLTICFSFKFKTLKLSVVGTFQVYLIFLALSGIQFQQSPSPEAFHPPKVKEWI